MLKMEEEATDGVLGCEGGRRGKRRLLTGHGGGEAAAGIGGGY